MHFLFKKNIRFHSNQIRYFLGKTEKNLLKQNIIICYEIYFLFQKILGFTQILVTKVAYLNILSWLFCFNFILFGTWDLSWFKSKRKTKVGENSRVGWWSHVFLVRIKHCELWATWKLNKSCQRRGDHVDNSLMHA